MSNINKYLEKILSARYGKDVRQSIHDAIKEIDAVADTAQNSATKSAESALASEVSAKASMEAAANSEALAEQYKNEAFSGTPEGYEALVEQVNRMDIATSNEYTLPNSKKGGYRLNDLEGNTVQNGEPSQSTPIAIENTFDCVEMMQGYYRYDNGVYDSNTTRVCTKCTVPCKSDDTINITLEKDHEEILVVFRSKGNYLTYKSVMSPKAGIVNEFVVPSGATEFVYSIFAGDTKPITPQTVGKITLTVNGKYVGQIVEHGKNFVGYSINQETNGVKVSTKGQTISLVGNATSDFTAVLFRGVLKEDTYILSHLQTNANTRFVLYKDGTAIQYIAKTDKPYTFIADGVSNYEVRMWVKSPNTFNDTMEVQIEKGTVATPIEEYQEKVTTFFLNEPLGATDRLARKDGVINENHKCGSVKASELTWNYRENVFFTKDIVDIRLCTHFRYTTNANITSNSKANELLSNGQCARIQGSSNDRVYFKNEDITSLDDWNTWIVENDFEIEYPLAEETYTPLDTTSQLALNDMETFDGVTYIEVDSNIPPTSISGEYGTSQVGAYTLKAMNVAESNAIKIEDAINTMLLITP